LTQCDIWNSQGGGGGDERSCVGSSRKFSFLSTNPLLEINEWIEKKK